MGPYGGILCYGGYVGSKYGPPTYNDINNGDYWAAAKNVGKAGFELGFFWIGGKVVGWAFSKTFSFAKNLITNLKKLKNVKFGAPKSAPPAPPIKPTPSTSVDSLNSELNKIIGTVDDFMESQLPRMNKKLGEKIGGNELGFPKSKYGKDLAVETVKDTLLNPSKISSIIPSSRLRGSCDLIHIFSSKTNFTVSLRVLENGKYEFDTLIKGMSTKF